jgi:hypothetical protein
MKPLCVSKQAFLISQTIRKSKLIEIITSVVHVSSFDETHSSTGSKRNTLSKLATSNPCTLDSNDEAQTLPDCLSQKKTRLLSGTQQCLK